MIVEDTFSVMSSLRPPRSFSTLLCIAMLVVVSFIFALNSLNSVVIAVDDEQQRVVSNDAVITNVTTTTKNKEEFIRPYRSPRNQTGSWIGNMWIPPTGWKLYSNQELQDFYREKSILWIGDSTARRAAMTMFAILNSTEPHVSVHAVNHPGVIDINRRKVTENCTLEFNGTVHLNICRGMNGKQFLIGSSTSCTDDMKTLVQEELAGNSTITQHIDLIIVSIGIWDGLGRCGKRPQEKLFASLDETMAGLNTLQAKRGTTFVWRTSGFSDDAHTFQNIPPMNRHAMDRIDQYAMEYQKRGIQSNFTYVNWGGAIEPRSRSPERIQGDIKPHYGLEPRLVLVQMITNVLKGN